MIDTVTLGTWYTTQFNHNVMVSLHIVYENASLLIQIQWRQPG